MEGEARHDERGAGGEGEAPLEAVPRVRVNKETRLIVSPLAQAFR